MMMMMVVEIKQKNGMTIKSKTIAETVTIELNEIEKHKKGLEAKDTVDGKSEDGEERKKQTKQMK